MCGIAGITGHPDKTLALNKIELMKQSLRHRGPDGHGTWQDDTATFGHTRLKIIDLSEDAAQPMVSDDGNFIIIYNGEVYNYQEIRGEIQSRYTWRSQSDTEVILNAFRTWGPACLERLNGMFAFAIWDIKNRSLFLARDRFGIKPLYYHIDEKSGALIFASEIKGILAAGIKPAPCYEKINQFLRWGALDLDNRTWFEGIRSLMPGQFLTWRNHQMTISTYYRLEEHIDEDTPLTGKHLHGRFRETLLDSVKLQLRSDREAGLHLSGGVDSSLLGACIKKVHAGPVKTYTFGYNEKQYDEREFAKNTATLLGFTNQDSVLAPDAIATLMTKTLREEDEPFTSLRQLSHHKLYADFKESGSTIILEASGGDETGAGYASYLYGYFMDLARDEGAITAGEWFNRICKHSFGSETIALNFILGCAINYESAGLSTSDGTPCVDSRFLSQSFIDAHQKETPEYKKPFRSFLRNQQYLDITYAKLPRGLRYIERASMASGREARLPLLDHRLVELGLQASNNEKIGSDGITRRFFQNLAAELVPHRNAQENKRSIADPQRHWMTHDLSGYVQDVLGSKKLKERGILNQQEILNYWSAFKAEDPAKNSLTLFQALITELWFNLFIDNSPSKP